MLEFKNSNQLKAFMKKEAKRLNISINNAYTTYFARCLLERIAKNNPELLLIKGSLAETAYLGRLVRAITDIDITTLKSFNESIPLLLTNIENNENNLLKFSFTNIKKTQTGIYQLSINANYQKISHPIGIDFQEKYQRLIKPAYQIMPSIFEEDKPFEIYAPSLEEYIAEKLCIILENNQEDVLNTRIKDFYDIYQIYNSIYDYDKLIEYFKKILKLRNKMKLESTHPLNLGENFIIKHKEIWDKTKMKKDFIDKEIDLKEAVYHTQVILKELLQKSGQVMDNNISYQYKKKS